MLSLFYKVDELSIIMFTLIGYVGICVVSFSLRYMEGNCGKRFFLKISLLISSILVMVTSDNLMLFFTAFVVGNITLVRLMMHHSVWKAANASGMIALKNYMIGSVFMGLAFWLFYLATGENSIYAIVHYNGQSTIMCLGLILLLLAAMSQSAIWPFHKWLLSSLNSPKPVSAVMHAGLVNGGGFILVRFAPLYVQYPQLMTGIFLVGMFTSLLGTLWKLMQSDVKRMHACSTIGQMGFMFVQCGLGLFPLAVAHLVWHGLFKAYLFLVSASETHKSRFDFSCPPSVMNFSMALICGMASSLAFSYASNKSWFAGDSTLVLLFVAFLAGSQLALPMLRILNLSKFLLALCTSIFAGFIYGLSVHFIVWAMSPMKLMLAQPLNLWHIASVMVLTFTWVSVILIRNPLKTLDHYTWFLKLYVRDLNASQPHPDTITAYRNDYNYKLK